MFFDILVFYCMVPDDFDKEEMVPLVTRYRRDDRYRELNDYANEGWAGRRGYQGQSHTPRRSQRRPPQAMYENDMDEADDVEFDERIPMGGERSASRAYDSGISGAMADYRGQSRAPGRSQGTKKIGTPSRGNPNTPSKLNTGTPSRTLAPTPSKLTAKTVTPVGTPRRPIEAGVSGGFVANTLPSRSVSVASRAPSAIRGGGASDEPRGRDRRVKDVGVAKYGGSENTEELDEVDDLMRRYAGANYK